MPEKRKVEIKMLDPSPGDGKKTGTKEELAIIKCHIKKGKILLSKLEKIGRM